MGFALAAPALAVVLALVISTAVLLATDHSPGEIYSLMLREGTTVRSIVSTLNRAGPYYLSGVAVAIGFKMNLFNIGVEGQYRLAALLAMAAGAAVTFPAPLHVGFILVVAMLAGGVWAGIAGILRATRGVSEVISTIMLNAIAIGVTAYLLTAYFQQERAGAGVDYSVGTEPLASSGRFPTMTWLLTGLGIDVPADSRLQAYLLVAVAVGIAYYVVVWRTRFGFDLRATGANQSAAEASGVNAKRMVVISMALSGAVAGLVGLNEVLTESGRYTDNAVLSGLGFTGIAIALLGRNNPLGIALGALLWAFMDVAQTPLSRAQLPNEIVIIMQGTIVLSVVVAYEAVRRIRQRREASQIARATTDPALVPA